MANFELRPGQGQLFKNRDRGNNDRAPTLKGSALLELADGSTVELDIAAWTKESEKAGKWLSLSVKLKAAQPVRSTGASIAQNAGRQRFNERVAKVGTPLDELDEMLLK